MIANRLPIVLTMQAQKALLRHLQKTFKITSQLCSGIIEKVKESKKCLASLSNLEEQYVCCKKVDFSKTPYKEFPGLKDGLLYKLVTSLEDEMEKLKDTLLEFTSANEKIQKQVQALFGLYQRYTEQLHTSELTEGHPTRPPLCDMIEWSQTIQEYFYTEYCKRKHLLQQSDYDKPETVSHLVEGWGSVQSFTHITTEIMPWVQFFLTEEI